MKNHMFYLLILILISSLLISCHDNILNEKPSSNLVVPSYLSDFQGLLDDNRTSVGLTPELGELSSDNYEIEFSRWQGFNRARSRNSYIWAQDIYNGEVEIPDWNQLYNQIFTANIVLEGLQDIATTSSNLDEWQRIKGSALFFRAHAFYELAQHFSPAFDKTTSNNSLGMPLRLSSNIHVKSVRSSLRQTYDQIIADLDNARILLKNNVVTAAANRPNRPAVYGLFSRVFLSMREYSKAGLYADSCLKIHDKLIDYNSLSKTSASPFSSMTYNNPEIIFFSEAVNRAEIRFFSGIPVVPMVLYNSYETGDLRKELFFRIASGKIVPKSGYSQLFTGIATDEMYLNRAECHARAGHTSLAMLDLNTLMRKRWDNQTTYVEFTASSAADALNQILSERRKELIYRGLRWTDLRRLNKDGANITLKRVLNGQEYLLPPNDPRYVFPIPDDEIALSGIEQNQR